MTSRSPFFPDTFFPGEEVSKDRLAIFWDMESVPAPCGTSPILVARMLRSQLGTGYKEIDLNVFCNVSRVRTEKLSELLNENVTLVQAQANCSKKKLSFTLQQFLNRHQLSCLHVILVSDDIDLLDVIEKARCKSVIWVIFASNHPSTEVSKTSFCVGTSFSDFVTALRESFMRYNKQAIVPAQHEEGQYEFSRYGPFENLDFELTNEDPSLQLSWEEEPGDSHVDTVSQQFTLHSDPPSERPEAHPVTINQYSPSSSHQAAEGDCRAGDGRNLKSKLLNALREHRVVLVVSNPGSGSGLDVAFCAQELGHRVLSIQPTDIEARMCATHACYGRTLTNVDCWLFHGQYVDSKATVVFTTASNFFQLFQNTGKELAGFQTIIVDGINEDNVYQRVNVNILQRYLQSDVNLIFCSTGLDLPLSVQECFHFGADNIVNCDVRFPVRVIWKEPSQDKLRACIDAIREFCSPEGPGGDILVFVPTVADAFEAKSLLEDPAKGLRCEVMYAGMIPLPSIEGSPQALWKVYFTVDCPDVSASLLNIRCVVDCGVVSTTALEGGIFVKEFRFLCAAEAEERRSLAAIRGEGTCYHVYSESEIISSCPSFTSELRYMEDVVLRLLAQKTDANTFFLEDVPKQLREEVKIGLQEIGAIDLKGQVTDLGNALCRISAEPRLGKLLFRSIGRLSTLDAILLSILAFKDLCAAFKGPRKQCGSPEVPLSEDLCGFANIIEIYKAWCSVPKNQKTTWCNGNMLNALFFDNLHSKATSAYSEFLKLRTHQSFQRNPEIHRHSVVTIGNILSECFPSGLLEVTEQGCQHPTLGKDMKEHRFSLVRHKLQPNAMAVCCLFSRDQDRATLEIMNACILPGDSECSPQSSNASSSTNRTEATKVHQRAVSLGSLICNGRYSHLHVQQFLEKELSGSSEIRKEEGSAVLDVARQHVLLVGTEHYCAGVRESLERFKVKLLMELQTEDREVLLTPTMSPFGRRPVQGVIGHGGAVIDVLSAAAFRTIIVRDAMLSVAEIEKKFEEFGRMVRFDSENEDNACYITYKTAGEANAAYIACKNGGGMTVEAKDQALRCRNDLLEGNAPLKIVVSFRPRINTLSASTGTLQHCQLQDDISSEQTNVQFASASASPRVVKHRDEKQCVGVNSQSHAQGLERDAPFSSYDIVSWNIKEILSAELGPQTPKLTIEDQIDQNGCIKGYLLFWDPEAAERALALLHEKQSRLDTTHSQSAPSEHLPVEVFVEGTFFLPLLCFIAIEGTFLEKMITRKKSNPTDHCDYEVSTYGNLVSVTLRGRYWQGYEAIVSILCAVLQGTEITKRGFSVNSQHVEQVIKDVAHPNDVYLIYKSGGVRLLGYKQDIQRVTKALEYPANVSSPVSYSWQTRSKIDWW
ncbi:hypothetical protein HPB48_015881 [Haemaphysalis longicornis]|uniref:NYN domain-containing protein n=1 Tax=Haemaphysalis longicornis TaxID=44386 RepID=A0A9J6FQC8_HAELO|nr:hypothetical protein HPB48_015881 [Haemaphysalis longicornis]